MERQGIVLFDVVEGCVYDIEFGQFEALARGEVEPIAQSFAGFLSWCMQRDPSG